MTTARSDDLNMLLALGIPKPRAVYALKEFGGDVEAAADWCLAVSRRHRNTKVGLCSS